MSWLFSQALVAGAEQAGGSRETGST